jgi:hypothetical protein
MSLNETKAEEEALALAALGWTLQDGPRAERLLALTGLTPENLRASLGEPTLLAAVLRFLESHEPDLLACAEALQVIPQRLVATRQVLER